MKELSKKEMTMYKKIFIKHVLDDEEGSSMESYNMSTPFGKTIYESFSDRELLNILIAKAKHIDHSPSQKEVSKVFREYIKARFKKWPYALSKAGLSKSGGSGGLSFDEIKRLNEEKKELLDIIRKETFERGYIPHPHQLAHIDKDLKKHFKYWGELVDELDIDFKFEKVDRSEISDEVNRVLEEIKDLAYNKLGRAPLKTEIDRNKRELLREQFGSWRNILFQIDLEPVEKRRKFSDTYLDHRKRQELGKHDRDIKECRFRVLNFDDREKEYLKEINDIIQKLDRKVEKKDIPVDMYKTLIKKCESFHNMIYQVELYIG